MINFYGLFSVDAAYIVTGMAVIMLISVILAIIAVCKASSIKKKIQTVYEGFRWKFNRRAY